MSGAFDHQIGTALGHFRNRRDGIAVGGVNDGVGPQTQCNRSSQRHGINHDDARTHADGGGCGHKTDGAATGHDDGLRCVDAAMTQHGVIAAGKGFDQCTLCVVDAVGQLVQPFGTGGKVFAIRPVHGKAEVVNTLWRIDDAFANDPVAGLQALDVASNLDNLSDPFMAGGNRIGNRDNVVAGKQFIIRMADTNEGCADHHLVVRNAGRLHVRDHGRIGFVEYQGLHRRLLP